VAEDPGWIPALGNFWRVLIFPTLAVRTRRGKAMPVLTMLRSLTIAAPASWLILYSALASLRLPQRPGRATFMLTALFADALLSLVILVLLRRRFRISSDEKEVVSTYRALFLLRWAMANSVVGVGFAGVLVTGRLWLFPIAMGLGILELSVIAPTHSRIERDQAGLRAAHSQVELFSALMLPNGEVPQRPKKR
jgi:hypothetical protein